MYSHSPFTVDIAREIYLRQVNADKVTWTVQDGKIVGQPKVNKSAVGICIATKAIGEMRTEDITLTYKYKEGDW